MDNQNQSLHMLPPQKLNGSSIKRTNDLVSTQRRVPRSLNYEGVLPRDKQSAELFWLPGIWLGEILSEFFRLKYSIPAKILNPRPAEHLLLRN